MDAFLFVRTLGYACVPQAEFDQYLLDVGLEPDGPLAALLRGEYEAAQADMHMHQQFRFHAARGSVAVPC